jgi:hypothetical protein
MVSFPTTLATVADQTNDARNGVTATLGSGGQAGFNEAGRRQPAGMQHHAVLIAGRYHGVDLAARVAGS